MHERYAAVDAAKLICAILVICIHTDPLSTYTETGNFILTRVLGRIAVPFFFVASSYFFFIKMRDPHRLLRYVKRIGWIYAVWSGLYLVVNVYKWSADGITAGDVLLYVKDFFLVGSYYHLWYLPALLFAVTLVYLLRSFLPLSVILVTAFLLYLLGLLADSYYGWTSGAVREVVDHYLAIFQYSRNGLFFAFVYAAIGAWLAETAASHRWSPATFGMGFALSLLLLTAEAMMVHRLELPMHDSMYLSLILCVTFAFLWASRIKLRERAIYKRLSTFSLLLYLIHPGVILAVRMAAGWVPVIRENSVLYFALIVAGTVMGCWIILQWKGNRWLLGGGSHAGRPSVGGNSSGSSGA